MIRLFGTRLSHRLSARASVILLAGLVATAGAQSTTERLDGSGGRSLTEPVYPKIEIVLRGGFDFPVVRDGRDLQPFEDQQFRGTGKVVLRQSESLAYPFEVRKRFNAYGLTDNRAFTVTGGVLWTRPGIGGGRLDVNPFLEYEEDTTNEVRAFRPGLSLSQEYVLPLDRGAAGTSGKKAPFLTLNPRVTFKGGTNVKAVPGDRSYGNRAIANLDARVTLLEADLEDPNSLGLDLSILPTYTYLSEVGGKKGRYSTEFSIKLTKKFRSGWSVETALVASNGRFEPEFVPRTQTSLQLFGVYRYSSR